MRAFLDRIFIETIPFRRSMCIQLAAAAAGSGEWADTHGKRFR